MAESSFKLKSLESIFAVTDPNSKQKNDPVYKLPLDKLFPFKDHPFKLYTGQRFDDMVDSIKAYGVIIPIIVRPIDDFTYEILSGHNRVESSKAAGLVNIPSIIKEDLTDEEALLIVTETNLIQRSFTDLSHSERAVTLSMHHEAIKKQGKRTDLIFEIENLLKASDSADYGTCSQVGNKLKTMEKVAQEYGMSKNSIARYLRINRLTSTFKELLDNGVIAFIPAVTISYLTETEQQIIDDVLTNGNYKIDMKKADSLRKLSESKKLTHETVEGLFLGKISSKKTVRPTAIKIKQKTVSKFFKPEQKQDEIEETIVKALEYYFSHNQNNISNFQEKSDIMEGAENAGEDLFEQTGEISELEDNS